jgi:hypothetical protein
MAVVILGRFFLLFLPPFLPPSLLLRSEGKAGGRRILGGFDSRSRRRKRGRKGRERNRNDVVLTS